MFEAAYLRSTDPLNRLGQHGCHSPTASVSECSATMETTKEGKIRLFRDSIIGVLECLLPQTRVVVYARGCCVSQHGLPSSEGPEKDSGLVLEPS